MPQTVIVSTGFDPNVQEARLMPSAAPFYLIDS
jgi:hypothetical protein